VQNQKNLLCKGRIKKNYRGKTKLTHITGDINLFSSYFTQSSTSDRTSKPLNPLNLKSLLAQKMNIINNDTCMVPIHVKLEVGQLGENMKNHALFVRKLEFVFLS
jgi:hypothetical protein